MEKLTEVLDGFSMGGYAAYVWPSFLIAGLVMCAMVVGSLRSLRRAQRALARLQQDAPLHEA